MDPALAIRIEHPDPADGVSEGLDGAIQAARFSEQTRADLVGLIEASVEDTADLYRARALHINPTFALSVPLGGADADLVSDGLLIDFKSTRDRTAISSKDIYQLVGYALADVPDECGIQSVGIQALRWRRRWTAGLDDLLEQLSGITRPLPEWRARFADLFRGVLVQLPNGRKVPWQSIPRGLVP